jgi:hypothetical protein
VKFSRVFVAGALVTLVAACGSNAPSGGTTPTSSPASATNASTPVATPAPDLTAELLTTSNLPAGWSPVANSDSGEPKCLDKVRSELTAISTAQATFVANANGLPDLEESLAYVPGHGQSDVTGASRILSGCGPISMRTGGQSFTGTIKSMPFAAVADQSSAYRMNLSTTVSGQSVRVVIDIVVFRKDDTVAMILYSSPGSPDVQALEHLVHDAAAKLS